MSATKAARALVICAFVSIAGGVLAQSSSATVPGQNGKIAFYYDADDQGELFTVDPDGSSLELFVGNSLSPAFSPDESSMTYIDRSAEGQLKVDATDGGNRPTAPLTSQLYGRPGSPAFDPRGDSVLYDIVDSGGQANLQAIPASGWDPVRIGEWSSEDLEVTVSPDGRKVAFVVSQVEDCGRGSCPVYSNPKVHIIRRNGTGERVLDTPLEATSPSFSPDGSRIAFTCTGPVGVSQICSIAVDGTRLRKLTAETTESNSPVYSPNGKRIAFSQASIRTMKVDGSGLRKVASSYRPEIYMGDWQRKAPFVIKGFKPRSRKLKTRLFGLGRLVIRGAGIRTKVRHVNSAGLKSTAIHLKRNLRRRLKTRPKVKVKPRARFAPKGALPNTLRERIILKRR